MFAATLGLPCERVRTSANHWTVIALVLTIMNTLAFSRCDKFSQASNLAGSALGTTNFAGSIASNMVSRWFTRN